MKKYLNFFIASYFILLPLHISSEEQKLKPFASDGCSAFPDGTPTQKKLWLSCCVAHDMAYWLGGSEEKRFVADKALQQCVIQVGEKTIAKIMLAGVRVGGSPHLPTSFRWGYGWNFPRGYTEPTKEEAAQAKLMLDEYKKSQAKAN